MNAMGPHVHDPRSGEIISAHIIVWHDVLRLLEMWYFVQCAPLDSRALKLPMAEPVMGELLRVVIAHEVGHTLGLRHNHKASSSYSIAQLRSKDFTEKYGDEASIMDYGRFNYVAQPGDGARLMPMLGPYDLFAIEWGYKPVKGAAGPADGKSALDMIAARQVGNPMLRFGGEDMVSMVDPTVQTEDLGSDPIEATTLGLKNIDRVAKLLIPATTRFGESYSSLQEMYQELLNQRQRELFHVAKLVGGVVETRFHAGRGGEPFKTVPEAKQAAAVQFLIDNGFSTPRALVTPALLNRMEFGGVADRLLNSQLFLVNALLSEFRIHRMMDRQALHGGHTYTVSQLVGDIQNGIWKELDSPAPAIDIYRRNLQRGYLKALEPRLVGDSASQTELRPLELGALRALQQKVVRGIKTTRDDNTRMHLVDCRQEIEDILSPKFIAKGGSNQMGFFFPIFLHFEERLPEAQNPGLGCQLYSKIDWVNGVMPTPAK